jgi:hypothetical protein
MFRTLKVNLTGNGLQRVLDDISPSALAHCQNLDLLMTEVDFPDELQKLYIKLLNNLTKVQTGAIQVARADGTSVIAHLPSTKAILRITYDLRPTCDLALSLKTLDGTGFAMVLDDFGAFLQCPFSKISVNGLTVIEMLHGDRELLAAITTLSSLRSFELHSSDVLPFYLTTMIQSKHLRKICMSRNRDPVSCAYIFNLRNVQETLVHASLLDMPFYRVADNKIASSAPYSSASPLRQTMSALQTLRIGQKEGPRNQNLALRPLFDAFRMPALKRLELVISGQQTWFLETVQDVMSQLPSLKEIHVDDEWYENFTSRPDQDFRAGVLAFEDFCRNKDIIFTLSVTIKTPRSDSAYPLNLRGLSDSLRLWSSFVNKIVVVSERSVNNYDDSHTPLILPVLEELVIKVPEDPPVMVDLSHWLQLLKVPKLSSITLSTLDEYHADSFVIKILTTLGGFKALRRLALELPVGTNKLLHDLKQKCAKQGVDFAIRFL